MVEMEVARLRRLRVVALRVRAVAQALSSVRSTEDDPVLSEAACAAWRVARAVSGRLRAHPYARFQRDAGLGSITANSVVAAAAAASATNRARVFKISSRCLRKMLRELEDTRAVTLTPELSDAFGRSLAEFRPLLARSENEVRKNARQWSIAVARSQSVYQTENDWPYITL